MSRGVGPPLPAALVDRLSARGRDTAIPICSVDEHGWPHPAMLSDRDVDVTGAAALRLRLHAGSRTAGHLRRDGRLTLLVVEASFAYYVKGRATPCAAAAGPADAFDVEVVQVLEDFVDTSREAAARIVSGIRFERPASHA